MEVKSLITTTIKNYDSNDISFLALDIFKHGLSRGEQLLFLRKEKIKGRTRIYKAFDSFNSHFDDQEFKEKEENRIECIKDLLEQVTIEKIVDYFCRNKYLDTIIDFFEDDHNSIINMNLVIKKIHAKDTPQLQEEIYSVET